MFHKENEFIDKDLLIPRHISYYALYSAQFILMDFIVAIQLEYYRAAFLLIGLYISTLLHWRKVYRISIIKKLDILFAVLSFVNLTFIDKYRFLPFYRSVWDITVVCILSLFLMNEYLFYYQVTRKSVTSRKRKRGSDTIGFYEKKNIRIHYFSLEKSEPATKYRDYCYRRNVYTHMVVIHIIPTTVSAFCALLSFKVT
jgi:hypothetical protein